MTIKEMCARFEDWFTEKVGDPDYVFSWTTEKSVEIRDRRLGIMYYVAMLLIAFYVMVYQLLLQQEYLKMWDSANTITLSLQEPTVGSLCNPLNNSCASNFDAMEDPGKNLWTGNPRKQYCCVEGCNWTAPAQGATGSDTCSCPGRSLPSHNCTYMDGAGAATVTGNSLLALTTRTLWMQDRNEDCFLQGTISGAHSCSKVWTLSDKGSTFFVKDIEDFVLRVDHTLSWVTDDFSKLIESTQIAKKWVKIGTGTEPEDRERNTNVCTKLGSQGQAFIIGTFNWVPATEAPCYVPMDVIQSSLLHQTTTTNPTLPDMLPLWVVLLSAGLELEDTALDSNSTPHSHRFLGVMISITIRYANLWPKPTWSLWTTDPYYIYSFKGMHNSTFSTMSIQKSFNSSNRIVEDRRGVYFEVSAGGKLATVSLPFVLSQFVTGLALTTMVVLFMEYVSRYALGHSHFYDAALIEKTTDFSNVDVLTELKTHDELYKMLLDGKLSVYGLSKPYHECLDKLRKHQDAGDDSDDEEHQKSLQEMHQLKLEMIHRLTDAGWVAKPEEEEEADRRMARKQRRCCGLLPSAEEEEDSSEESLLGTERSRE